MGLDAVIDGSKCTKVHESHQWQWTSSFSPESEAKFGTGDCINRCFNDVLTGPPNTIVWVEWAGYH